MWEILFGYGIEKIFGRHTTAFEIGGEIVQTSVSGIAPSQGISKITVAAKSGNTVPSLRDVLVKTRSSNESGSRPLVQVGFNPFGPVLIYGAEQLLKHIDYETHTYDDRAY